MSEPLALPVHVAALDDIAPRQLYGIMQLQRKIRRVGTIER